MGTAPWYHPLPSEVSITPRLWSGKQICLQSRGEGCPSLTPLAMLGRTEQLTNRKGSVTVHYFVPDLGRLKNGPFKQSLLPISSLPFPQNLNSGILPRDFIETSPSGTFCWQKVSNWCQPEKAQPLQLLSFQKSLASLAVCPSARPGFIPLCSLGHWQSPEPSAQ